VHEGKQRTVLRRAHASRECRHPSFTQNSADGTKGGKTVDRYKPGREERISARCQRLSGRLRVVMKEKTVSKGQAVLLS
jgi:hypothetical protein